MQLRPGSDGHALKCRYWEKGRRGVVPALPPRSQDRNSWGADGREEGVAKAKTPERKSEDPRDTGEERRGEEAGDRASTPRGGKRNATHVMFGLSGKEPGFLLEFQVAL